MYENTGAARARDGGRADRRRASTCTRSTGASTRASRRASSSCWRAGSTHVERFDGGLLTRHAPHARGLRARPAPTRATPRASSTTCARSRAPRSPALVRDLLGDGRAGRARSRCARPTTASTSRAIARAQGGGGHRRAAGFSTDLEYPRAGRVPARASSPSSSERPTASSLVDKPAGITSHDVVARRAAAARARA